MDFDRVSFSKINISFLVVGLLLGSIGGYFAAFATYQPKINDYEKRIDDLTSEISRQNLMISDLEANFSNTQNQISSYKTLISHLKSQISALARARIYGDVSVEQAKELIETNTWLLILDVRTKLEFENGHIEGAINIPLSELEKRLGELNKTDEILVYCWAGQRSSQAVEILADNGFIGVYNMLNGIEAWIQGGHPTREGCGCG